jgi:AcrR family transcriptional regulator
MARVKRDAQRRRTRRAVVGAAADLLGQGRTPSIAEIAEAAEVSRRTVYMYFPSLEHLLADAALEAARETVEPQFELTDDVAQRVEAMVRAVQRSALETEELGRTIIRHTIEARETSDSSIEPRRGYRRVEWIELALEPARAQLGEERFERLVSAFTLLVGWEALLVLRDTRGLAPDEAEDLSAWAATSLLAAALAEASARGSASTAPQSAT